MDNKYKTPQEQLWAGEFGTNYIDRNNDEQLLASNLAFFSKALKRAGHLTSCIEFGANIGMNLRALRLLYPAIRLNALEINQEAARQLAELIGEDNVFEGSVFDHPVSEKAELLLIKGVLIHINPEMLTTVYEKLYQASSRLILVCEYYNPTRVSVTYRGIANSLFKGDFAGEMLEKYPNLELVDYGFSYHRDPTFPQDDISWFLMQKTL